MSFGKTVWKTLSALDVGKHIEKKGNLSYLSWTWAWAAFMDAYPESTYEMREPVTHSDGSVMCHCEVTAREGEESLSRQMWLPVMDHRNKAIQNPSATDINKTQMRCLVKCLAMFGLGHYIYAGEDLPNPEAVEQVQRDEYLTLVANNKASIDAIKEGIASDDLSAAAEAWFELDQDTMRDLWKAPTKGGCFTTKEREVMKSPEFRKAFYGEERQAS